VVALTEAMLGKLLSINRCRAGQSESKAWGIFPCFSLRIKMAIKVIIRMAIACGFQSQALYRIVD
jgi:hypothetical protein